MKDRGEVNVDLEKFHHENAENVQAEVSQPNQIAPI